MHEHRITELERKSHVSFVTPEVHARTFTAVHLSELQSTPLLARARDNSAQKGLSLPKRDFTARCIDPALQLRVSSRRIGLWRLGANREPNQKIQII